ncbi:MAG: phage head morphogenesis protein [Oscillospiraceae bacterium]|nr:phage head morphogenesis protein [Oscillospiraceae bacterium]
MCIRCGKLIKAIDAYIAKADSDLAATLGGEGYIEPQETVNAVSTLEERVAAALLSETDYIIKAVKKAHSLAQFQMDIWPKLKEGDTLQTDLQTIFLEEFGEIVRKFAGFYFSAIENGNSITKASIEIVRVSKQTTAWVQNWSQELAAIMKLNSHTEIESILTSGLEGGIGIPEFTRKIIDSGIRDEWRKARRVAITEVLTAHRAGQQEAYLQSPSTSAKMWRHTGTYVSGPRLNHKDMDGRKVPKDQPFELLGADGNFYHPMYPGDTSLPPGERIECHCTTQGIVDEDVLGLPLEERQRLQQEAIDELDDKWEKELEDRNKALAGFTDDAPLTPTPATPTMNRESLVSSIKGKFDMQLTEPQRAEFGAILDRMTDEQLQLYDKMSVNHAKNLYHLKNYGAYYPDDKKVRMDIDDPFWERHAGTGQTAAWHTKFHEECHQLDHILAKMGIDFENTNGVSTVSTSAITSTSTETGKKLLKAIEDDIVSVINRAVGERNAKRLELDLDADFKTIKSLSRISQDTKETLIFWLRDNFKTGKARAQIDMFTDAVGLVTKDRIPLYKSGFWGHPPKYNKDRDGNGATSETFATFGSLFFSGDEETKAVVQDLMPSTWKIYSDLFAKIMKLAEGRDILYP